MRKKIAEHILLQVAAIFLLCHVLFAEAPHEFVKNLEADVRAALIGGDVTRANGIFAEHFQMELFAKRCLIDHFQKLTVSEQKSYTDLLRRNIKKRMGEKMLVTGEDTKFSIVPQKVGREDDLIRIDTALYVKKGTFGLGIFLVREKGALKVVDYDFDGALLSRNYRGQFNYIIRKHGKAGLFAKLENKLER